MTALFDSGNSRLHFAWWDGESLLDAVSRPYPPSPGEISGLVNLLLGDAEPETILACSVSPKYGESLFAALDSRFHDGIRIIRSASDAGIRVFYDMPEQYGVDRALAANAGYRLFHDSCVVVGAGTAVTVDALDGEGMVRGGYIFPGDGVMAFALASRTGLPEVTADWSSDEPGTSTETCISRGISLGMAGAVRLLVERAVERVDCGDRIVITGGSGEKLLRALAIQARYRPFLVLEGLGLLSGSLPKEPGTNAV